MARWLGRWVGWIKVGGCVMGNWGSAHIITHLTIPCHPPTPRASSTRTTSTAPTWSAWWTRSRGSLSTSSEPCARACMTTRWGGGAPRVDRGGLGRARPTPSTGRARALAGGWGVCQPALNPPTHPPPPTLTHPHPPPPCAAQVREFVGQLGVENLSKRLVNSREGKVVFDKPRMSLDVSPGSDAGGAAGPRG